MNLSDYLHLQPKQQQAIQQLLGANCKYFLYGGSMAGGKSFLLRWAAFLYSIYLWKRTGIRNIPIGLFSEDYPTLKDRQISRIIREFPPALGELKETKNEGNCFFINDNLGGGRILLRNLDDPSKYMSTEFAGEFVEELTRLPEQTFIDLRNRLRYPGIEEVKFMGASNPGGIGHGWVKKLFVDQNTADPEQERFFYIHANVYDNKYISPDYVKQLESLPEQQKKAYLYGSWDVFAGQYFPEWNQLSHTVLPFYPDKTDIIVGGMDWGYSAPFAFHLTQIEKLTYKEVHFYRAKTFLECYGTGKTPKEWAESIAAEMKRYYVGFDDILWIQGDPAMFNKSTDGSISIRDQFIQADPGFRKLRPASNDRIPGWINMHKWLSFAPDGLPYWQVSTECKNLIRTLPELVHDELKIEDVDTHGEDHCLHGDTLIHTTEGKKKIVDLVGKSGYLYSIGSGINSFTNVRQTGISEVYRIYFENGLYVDATSLHPFLSITGEWIATDRLTSHDLIQCLYENYCTIRYEAKFQRIKLLQMRILLQQAIQKIQWIKKIAQRSMDIPSWTDSKGISYSSQRSQPKQQPNRKLGITQIIRSFISSLTNSRSQRTSTNQSQKIRSTRSSKMAQIPRGFSVAQNSRTTYALKIKKIVSLGKFPVYNLEVENTQCFAINGGILVHNSPDALRYQFKGLKWIDGNVGIVAHASPVRRRQTALINPNTGKQIAVDLNKFTNTVKQQKSWWND